MTVTHTPAGAFPPCEYRPVQTGSATRDAKKSITPDTVVTYERPAPQSIRSIPDACEGLAVDWTAPHEMLSTEGVRPGDRKWLPMPKLPAPVAAWLISLWVMSELRRRGVPKREIRAGGEYVAEHAGTDYPFAQQSLATVGAGPASNVRNRQERENRGRPAPPAGPSPTATTLVRGATA